MTTHAVVLLSGGLDSCVAATLAKKEYDRVSAISFRYGSLHEDNETRSARRIATILQLYNHTIIAAPPVVFTGGMSALLGEKKMPAETYEELAAGDGPSPTYVPYRNGVLLSMAVAHALTVDAGTVIAGAHAEDARGFAYPDCTPEFNGAMSAAVYVGTYHQVRLRFPFQEWTKAEIVLAGLAADAPLGETWSCYAPQDGRPCGTCPTCVGRAQAFNVASTADPALA